MQPSENTNHSKNLIRLIISCLIILILTILGLIFWGFTPKKPATTPQKNTALNSTKTKNVAAYDILLKYPDTPKLLNNGDDMPQSPVLEIPPRWNDPITRFKIFPNQYQIHLNYWPENVTLSFDVDVKNETVKPYFEEIKNYKPIEGNVDINIPNTKLHVIMPRRYKFIPNADGINSIKGTDLGLLLFHCGDYMQEDWQFCRDLYANFSTDELTKLKAQRLQTEIKVVETTLPPDEWVLDNVNYQGETLRQLRGRYPTYDAQNGNPGDKYIFAGKNKLYVIRMGCCGDPSISYIYRTKNGDKLVIFRSIFSDENELMDFLANVYEE